jgi:putative transcriptional regulator
MEARNKIREFREEQNLTQEELAQKAGVYQEAIRRTERLQTSRNIEYWIRVARALGKTVEDIYILPEK